MNLTDIAEDADRLTEARNAKSTATTNFRAGPGRILYCVYVFTGVDKVRSLS